jgi:hypothetical protein
VRAQIAPQDEYGTIAAANTVSRVIQLASWTIGLVIGTAIAPHAVSPEVLAAGTEALSPASDRHQVLRRIVYPPARTPRLTLPDGSSRPIRSLLKAPGALHHGGFVWDDAGVPSGTVWIRVDLSRQLLSVFRAGHEIGAAVILHGAASKPTPQGVYPVLERAEKHSSNLYRAEMPYMLRLTADGIAIHASDVRSQGATHGCIGVPLAFARRLFGQVRRGDLVAVL